MLRGLEIFTVYKIARPKFDYQDTINIARVLCECHLSSELISIKTVTHCESNGNT